MKNRLAKVQPATPPLKVAIVAFTHHQRLAPWTDPTWELWGLNDLHSTFEHFAGPDIFTSGRVRWFQLHREDSAGFHGARDPNHLKWMQAQTKTPIYMWHTRDDIPMSREYPLRDILREFRPYFNNTISWMIALAIHEGAKEIGIYGVDMALDGVTGAEYGHQRPSCEYFCGVAEAKGIKMYLPDESELLKVPYLYGYDNIDPLRRKLIARAEQLEAQEQSCADRHEAIKRSLHEIRGAKQERAQILRDNAIADAVGAGITTPQLLADAHQRIAGATDPRLQELDRAEQEFVNEYEANKRALHETRGAKNDVAWLLRNYIGPGEGGMQDLPRTERSVVRDEIVSPSIEQTDGKHERLSLVTEE